MTLLQFVILRLVNPVKKKVGKQGDMGFYQVKL